MRATKTAVHYTEIVRNIVAKIDVAPDYTEIVKPEEHGALQVAFIESDVNQESRAELRDFEERYKDGTARIAAALPEPLQELARTLESQRQTMDWIREEIAYAIGIEVGRRMAVGR